MGVTIHYRGTLNQKSSIQPLIEEVSDICDSMNWEYEVLDEDWSIPPRLKVNYEEEGVNLEGHAGLKGVTFTPHIDCEPVRITFDAKGQLNSVMNLAFNAQKDTTELPWVYTKTQFAGVETHVSIIKLLKYIKKRYVTDLEVNDEGNYWNTEDITEVNSRMHLINNAMQALEAGLKDLEGIENLTEEGILKKIQDVIEDIGKQEGIQIKVMRVDADLGNEEEEEKEEGNEFYMSDEDLNEILDELEGDDSDEEDSDMPSPSEN